MPRCTHKFVEGSRGITGAENRVKNWEPPQRYPSSDNDL